MSKTATPKNMVKALASNDSTLENEAGDFYVDIDSLQAHGVNMADLKKLKSVGICTTRGLKMITKKKLCNIKTFSSYYFLNEWVSLIMGASFKNQMSLLQFSKVEINVKFSLFTPTLKIFEKMT